MNRAGVLSALAPRDLKDRILILLIPGISLLWYVLIGSPVLADIEHLQTDMNSMRATYQNKIQRGSADPASLKTAKRFRDQSRKEVQDLLNDLAVSLPSDFDPDRITADAVGYLHAVLERRDKNIRQQARTRKPEFTVPERFSRVHPDFLKHVAPQDVAGILTRMGLLHRLMVWGMQGGLDGFHEVEVFADPVSSRPEVVCVIMLRGQGRVEPFLKFIHQTQRKDNFMFIEKLTASRKHPAEDNLLFEIHLGGIVMDNRRR